MRRMTDLQLNASRSAACVLALLAIAGCAHHRHREMATTEQFSADAPFSKVVKGEGEAVCWSVKRALLSQGYMLDRSSDSGVLAGTRDYQPQPDLNVSIHLQAPCADNRDGTSIVFVMTATPGRQPAAEDEADDQRRHRPGDADDAVRLRPGAGCRAAPDDRRSGFLRPLF